ncbi:antibiotic biosynthesis monooxygenase family protein [Saccharicrinis sp. FJH54]|uniref:antibiotic biosynthesis monooxygenase family protein n=1 Tax=Saccharicrinis sp. FJH54 TaxID=3344665 RepID=UPI0035D4D984
MDKMYANTPKPPYYAVIFTSVRTEGDLGYSDMSDTIEELVKEQPGFIGMESARNEVGITVCYWKDMESIRRWAKNSVHRDAKQKGRAMWYESYKVRISKVELEY